MVAEMNFAEKLKEAMKLAGINTEQELADLSGVTYGTVHGYLGNRRRPSFENAAKLAKACGFTSAYFDDIDEVIGKHVPRKRARKKKTD